MSMKVVMKDPRKHDYFYDEASKKLRTNIRFTGTGVKSIVVTSCYPNEGKSDILFQLSIELGNMGKRVLILDADIRKSTYLGRYQVERPVRGLSEYLSGQCEVEDMLYTTNYPGVDIIFAGPTAPNPSELLEQESFGVLVHTMRERYDCLLYTSPSPRDA